MCPQEADNFGCEFIDDGNYGKVSEKRLLKPWMANYPNSIELPIPFLMYLADEIYLKEIIRKDIDLIENLRSDIIQHGQREPGVIIYDKKMSIRFQDGNHRLVAMSTIPGLSEMAVELKPVQQVRARGRSFAGERELLALLRALSEDFRPRS